MFRDVPECSGMFHVPAFIDGLQSEQSYKFFQFFRMSGVVNSISEKKKRENFFSDASEFSHSFCRE